MEENQALTTKINDLHLEYLSFYRAAGWKRVVAVKWAQRNIKHVANIVPMNEGGTQFLQRVGWTTYVGCGLYAGVVSKIIEHGTAAERAATTTIVERLKQTLISVNELTDIGYHPSLGSSFELVEALFCARVDDMGNVLIYPEDADRLVTEVFGVLQQ